MRSQSLTRGGHLQEVPTTNPSLGKFGVLDRWPLMGGRSLLGRGGWAWRLHRILYTTCLNVCLIAKLSSLCGLIVKVEILLLCRIQSGFNQSSAHRRLIYLLADICVCNSILNLLLLILQMIWICQQFHQ